MMGVELFLLFSSLFQKMKFSNGTEPLLRNFFLILRRCFRSLLLEYQITLNGKSFPNDPISLLYCWFFVNVLRWHRRKFNSIFLRLSCYLSAWSTAKVVKRNWRQTVMLERTPTEGIQLFTWTENQQTDFFAWNYFAFLFAESNQTSTWSRVLLCCIRWWHISKLAWRCS